MSPEQKIKHAILLRDEQWHEAKNLPEITAENVDDLFEQGNADWELQDALEEVRQGEVETDIKCDWSRHYESKAVAAKMPDGSWVGWTYWYGGGKHGEPKAIDWMDSAYDLNVVEEEKVVTVRTFTRADQ